jgi:hypothetical protein
MTNSDKVKYKNEFKSAWVDFIKTLNTHISSEDGQWTIKGFIDTYKNIYTITSDTKIVSKILEIHLFPEIIKFAEINNYSIVLAEKQNWYPDLTFIKKNNTQVKFALDLKTTFRRNNQTAGFTLGSHGGYFRERDKDKNIQFPYSQYLGHYCLGVIYSRSESKNVQQESETYQVRELQIDYGKDIEIGERQITTIENLRSIVSVIRDFDFFFAEKWKISSDSQGSGNTANIGSILNIDDLKKENGVFSKLGEEWFDEYWINYGVASILKDGKPIKITSIWDFLELKGRNDLFKKVVASGAKKRRQIK